MRRIGVFREGLNLCSTASFHHMLISNNIALNANTEPLLDFMERDKEKIVNTVFLNKAMRRKRMFWKGLCRAVGQVEALQHTFHNLEEAQEGLAGTGVCEALDSSTRKKHTSINTISVKVFESRCVSIQCLGFEWGTQYKGFGIEWWRGVSEPERWEAGSKNATQTDDWFLRDRWCVIARDPTLIFFRGELWPRLLLGKFLGKLRSRWGAWVPLWRREKVAEGTVNYTATKGDKNTNF